MSVVFFFFFKQKTAYEMSVSDWSSDVCSSDLLERRRKSQATVAIPRSLRPDHGAPLSFAQQRLWLLHEMNPRNYFYNVPRGLRLLGSLNVDALSHALNEIVRRHETLRTSF